MTSLALPRNVTGMQTDAPTNINTNPAASADPTWWLKSKTLHGVLVLACAFLLSKFSGHSVDPTDQQAVDLSYSFIAALGALWAIWGRCDAQGRLKAAQALIDFAPVLHTLGAALVDENGEEKIVKVVTAPPSGPDANSQARTLSTATTNTTQEAPQAATATLSKPTPGGSATATPEPAGGLQVGLVPSASDGGFIARPLIILLALIGMLGLALFCLSGCATNPATGKKALTPQAKATLTVVGEVVEKVAIDAAEAYVSGGTVGTPALAADALSGAAFGLRTIESTPSAGSPATIATALRDQAGNSAIASPVTPTVQYAVSDAVKNGGVSTDAALEAAAAALDTAAAKTAAKASSMRSRSRGDGSLVKGDWRAEPALNHPSPIADHASSFPLIVFHDGGVK